MSSHAQGAIRVDELGKDVRVEPCVVEVVNRADQLVEHSLDQVRAQTASDREFDLTLQDELLCLVRESLTLCPASRLREGVLPVATTCSGRSVYHVLRHLRFFSYHLVGVGVELFVSFPGIIMGHFLNLLAFFKELIIRFVRVRDVPQIIVCQDFGFCPNLLLADDPRVA